MQKKLLIFVTALTLLAPAGVAFATPSSVDRVTDHIEPLIKTDFIRAPYFTATSTSKSTFPTASTTNVSIGGLLYDGSNSQGLLGNILKSTASGIQWVATSTLGFLTTNVAEGTNLYFTNARAIAALLTGFTSGAGTVSASDSILTAIQKLDGNIAGKQAAGNYITALTGDVTASGPGSAAATLATVNGNVGSFTCANLTANGKGLITAVSNGTCSGGSGGTVGTSTKETIGYIPVWTTTNGSPALLAGTSSIFQLNGNVGIGSTSPLSTLSVTGSGTTNPFTVASSSGLSMLSLASNGVLTNAGTYNGAGVRSTAAVSSGTNAGAFLAAPPAANDLFLGAPAVNATGRNLVFVTSGSLIQAVASAQTGNWGIGTTSTSAVFHIQAPPTSGNVSGLGSLADLFDVSTTTSAAYATSSLFVIKSTGNVGIASGTPGYLLSIKGSNTASTTTSVQFTDSANTSIFSIGNGGKVGIDDAPSAGVVTSGLEVGDAGWQSATVNTEAFIGTPVASRVGLIIRGASGQTADYFRITDVFGNQIFAFPASGVPSFGLGLNVGATGVQIQGGSFYSLKATGNDLEILNNSNGSLPFYATTAGLVGIGSSTPLSTLSVTGSGTTNPFTVASSSGNSMFSINNFGAALFNNQAGTSGFVLQSFGASAPPQWVSTTTLGFSGGGGSGTVTSVALTVPTGLSISGSPVTTSGTLAVTLTAGYNIPLTASTTNWQSFFATPSTQITAGTNLSWSGNTLNGPADSYIRGLLSSTATGLTYTSSTGVFSLTSGYSIPLTASTTDWQTAFTNRITSLTTTGSGAATLTGNVLNIPTPTGYSPVGTTGQLPYFSASNTLTATSSVFLSSTGNFGIGSTSPSAKLSIHDFSGLAGTNPLFAVASSTAAGAATSTLFTVLGNGNVGIGTTSPLASLSINSLSSTTPYIRIASSTTTILDYVPANSPQFRVGTSTAPWTLSITGTVGFDGLTGSSGLQTGILCLSASKEVINESVACVASAKRYKENIQDLGPGLDELMQFRPVSFTWKKDFLGSNAGDPNQNGVQYSLIADEVQKIDPHLISLTTSETTFEGKTYPAGSVNGLADMNHWVALIVKSVQELAVKNDTTNDAQDAKIAAMQAEIDTLTAESTVKKNVMMCSL